MNSHNPFRLQLKRILGIVLLVVCGVMAILAIIFIQVLIEQPKDFFTLLGLGIVVVVSLVIFFVVRFSLRLMERPLNRDDIDEIGK